MVAYGPCFKIFVVHRCIVNIGDEALLKVRYKMQLLKKNFIV